MAKNKTKKEHKLWNEFKAFISRGNVLDMAVGVIIGGAFGAIVTALVNILMSVCTWGVPGGIAGLVTVLPAANPVQEGILNIGQKFAKADLDSMVIQFAANSDVTITTSSDTFIQWKNSLLGLYTLHGTTYTYNMSAVIDWGTFINAIISFLIIAITLFIIVKVASSMAAKREALKAKAQEEYYEKHPEERPLPPEEVVPEPTTNELLTQILETLKQGK